MKNFAFAFCILLSSMTIAQISEFEDNLINDMCETFKETSNLSDSLRVENMYLKHLYPYFDQIEENKIDSVGMSIYYRLQVKCPEFLDFLNQVDPKQDGETTLVNEKPISKISLEELNEFKNRTEFHYIDNDGKIAKVKIENNLWVETFEDGTFSKNQMTWASPAEFNLTFIESNNPIKKSLSKKGEVYEYWIVSVENDVYKIAYEIPKINQFVIFKLYNE